MIGDERRRIITKQDRAAMRRLRKRGMSIPAIAAELAIAKSAVHREVRDIDVDARPAANAARAAIPPAWWPAAQRLLRSGMTRHAVARELGLPLSNVYKAAGRHF